MGEIGRPRRDAIYARLDYQIEELHNRLGGLPSQVEARDIWRGIWYEEAHNSTAIEGNTLVLKQVQLLLDEGRAVGGKQLKEYLEVKGYGDAAQLVYEQALSPTRSENSEWLTLQEVRNVHHLAMQPVWEVEPHPDAMQKEAPGHFREHDIHPFPDGMTPPLWPLVDSQMSTWVEEANQLVPRAPEIAEEVARLHGHFEQIHPFIDGNGRTGRLILNLLLVRMGYPPAIIYKKDRAKYLKALRKGDDGDYGPLGEFVARAILDNLYRFVVPAVAGSARLVPLPALASDQINANALRAAAVRGALEATKGADGEWRSSRNWVDEYLKGRYKRRG